MIVGVYVDDSPPSEADEEDGKTSVLTVDDSPGPSDVDDGKTPVLLVTKVELGVGNTSVMIVGV